MSLQVKDQDLVDAQGGSLTLERYVEEILRPSLPYPMTWVDRLRQILGRSADGYAEIDEAPLTVEDGKQLLRFGFGDSFAKAVGERYGITLAFQNCHAMAAVAIGDEANPRFVRFASIEAQVLNQSPEKVDC